MLVLCVVWAELPWRTRSRVRVVLKLPLPAQSRCTAMASYGPHDMQLLHQHFIFVQTPASISPFTRWTESIDRPIWRLGTLQLTCKMENTGFDYIVKPLEDFAKGSIRLVKRCTKPDKKGEEPALLCLDDSLVSATCVYAWRQ